MIAIFASTFLVAAASSAQGMPFSTFESIWTRCVETEASIYAETNEGEETIAEVAASKCDVWSEKLRESWEQSQQKPSSDEIEAQLSKLRERNRMLAMQTVMDWRLRFKN